MLPKFPFYRSNSKFAIDHWVSFGKCKMFLGMQHNINQFEEVKNMFAFIL